MTVNCAACGKATITPAMDQPHVLNMPACSVVTLQHPETFACEHCGAQLVAAVARVNLNIIGVPAPPKKQPNLIIAPGRTH